MRFTRFVLPVLQTLEKVNLMKMIGYKQSHNYGDDYRNTTLMKVAERRIYYERNTQAFIGLIPSGQRLC